MPIFRHNLCAAAFFFMAFTLLAAASESAPYQLLKADGKFELRVYPVLTLVEASAGTNADGNFMRLFRFINGRNDQKQKIAMTTPVFMDGSQTNATMAFVMPAAMTSTNTPKPKDSGLRVKEMPPGRFAALRFKGYRNAKNETIALTQLREWMKAQGLTEASPPVFAYFNPPWTLGFLRHNEVMIRLAEKQPDKPNAEN
jgi:DNA gyrase inhibitor GyrI